MMKLRCIFPLVCATLLATPVVAQSDVYWQASRTSKELHRINACGEVDLKVDLSTNNFPTTSAPQLRSAHLAPDGQVWVINFIVPHFTMLNGDGTNIRNFPILSGGRPFTIEFDKAGQAYMSQPGKGVEVYDKNGKLLKTYAITGNVLGLSADSDGNIWCAHRLSPPSKVTKIDVAKGTTTDYTFPTGVSTLGGQVVADYQGILKKSTIWCLGDRSSELLNFDTAGKHLGTYTIDPNSTTISAMTIDAKNNLWIGNFRTPDIFYFDTKLKKVVKTLQSPPNVLGLAMDSRGRLLATARVSFSGPQPSVVRRFNTTTFDVEQVSTVGIGAGSAAHSGFHHALVVDPFGDADKDKVANFAEVTGPAGTGVGASAPYDAQSTNDRNLLVSGPNERGGKVTINLLGKSGSTAFLGVALKKLATPVCIPAWDGCLLVDPGGSSLAAVLSFKVPASLPQTIPNDRSLIGTAVYFQALYDLGGAQPSWSNRDCLFIYK